MCILLAYVLNIIFLPDFTGMPGVAHGHLPATFHAAARANRVLMLAKTL